MSETTEPTSAEERAGKLRMLEMALRQTRSSPPEWIRVSSGGLIADAHFTRRLITDVDTLQRELAELREERDAERLVHHTPPYDRLAECPAAQQERQSLAGGRNE